MNEIQKIILNNLNIYVPLDIIDLILNIQFHKYAEESDSYELTIINNTNVQYNDLHVILTSSNYWHGAWGKTVIQHIKANSIIKENITYDLIVIPFSIEVPNDDTNIDLLVWCDSETGLTISSERKKHILEKCRIVHLERNRLIYYGLDIPNITVKISDLYDNIYIEMITN